MGETGEPDTDDGGSSLPWPSPRAQWSTFLTFAATIGILYFFTPAHGTAIPTFLWSIAFFIPITWVLFYFPITWGYRLAARMLPPVAENRRQ